MTGPQTASASAYCPTASAGVHRASITSASHCAAAYGDLAREDIDMPTAEPA